MKNTLFTTLCYLAKEHPEQLAKIFQPAGSRRPVVSSSFSHCIVQPRPTGNSQAVNKLKDLIDTIKNAHGDLMRGMSEVHKILTDPGLIMLLQTLVANCDSEDIAERTLNPFLNVQAMFKGLPLFKVVIEDARPGTSGFNPKLGRYDFYIENPLDNTRKLIEFSTHEAKIIYLWFLLHPRQEYEKTELEKRWEEFSTLYEHCYREYNKNPIKDKMTQTVDKKLRSVRSPFDTFWTQNKSNCNTAIQAAIAGADDLCWYEINKETATEKQVGRDSFSLSLPSEFIILPDSLRDFQF